MTGLKILKKKIIFNSWIKISIFAPFFMFFTK